MICRKSRVKSNPWEVPVYLNVYDLKPSLNGYAHWLGLGAYHSGVQVNGVEYAFGGHEYSTTGIFEGVPKQCDGFTFRKTILIGWTNEDNRGVMRVIKKLSQKYKGDSYDLISKNCNHFCNDACIELTGNPIPNWVNRLARIGLLCKCIVPAELTKIEPKRSEDKVCDVEKNKLRNHKNKLSSKSSSCPLTRPSTGSHVKTSFPQSSPSITDYGAKLEL